MTLSGSSDLWFYNSHCGSYSTCNNNHDNNNNVKFNNNYKTRTTIETTKITQITTTTTEGTTTEVTKPIERTTIVTTNRYNNSNKNRWNKNIKKTTPTRNVYYIDKKNHIVYFPKIAAIKLYPFFS